MRRNDHGFSLIELLVVITILAALAAGGTVFFRIANQNRDKAITNQRMNAIAAGLEAFKQAAGYYPPSYTSDLRGTDRSLESAGGAAGTPNETNIGIETLWVAFHLPGLSVNMDDLGDSALENTDEDQMAGSVGTLTDLEMYEFVDAWGNPFVYFAAKDLKDVSKVNKYVTDGNTVEAAAYTKLKGGGFARASSYQLFSCGVDGLPNTPDDLPYGMDPPEE